MSKENLTQNGSRAKQDWKVCLPRAVGRDRHSKTFPRILNLYPRTGQQQKLLKKKESSVRKDWNNTLLKKSENNLPSSISARSFSRKDFIPWCLKHSNRTLNKTRNILGWNVFTARTGETKTDHLNR